MTKRPHPTPEQRQDIVKEALAPDRPILRAIADKYGVSTTTLHNWVSRHKAGQSLDRKQRSWPTPSVRRYQDYINHHPFSNQSEAGRALGLSRQRIQQIIQGIKRHAARND